MQKGDTRMRAAGRGKAPNGFTLVELFVGMAIFGMIAVGIYATFANAVRFNRRARQADDFYRDVRMTVDILTSDLENMTMYHARLDSGERHRVVIQAATDRNVRITERSVTGLPGEGDATGSFIGHQDSLSLVRSGPDGLREVRYFLEAPEDVRIYKVLVGGTSKAPASLTTRQDVRHRKRYCLMREERPFPYVDTEDEASRDEAEIVNPNILEDGLEFSYAGRDEFTPDGELAWEEEWMKDEAPEAVRVRIAVSHPRDDRTWELVQDIYIPIGQGPLTVSAR